MARMKLGEWLSQHSVTPIEFAARIGRHRTTVVRLVRGLTTPDPDTMQAILTATDGVVTPNDFFDLPGQKAKAPGDKAGAAA